MAGHQLASSFISLCSCIRMSLVEGPILPRLSSIKPRISCAHAKSRNEDVAGNQKLVSGWCCSISSRRCFRAPEDRGSTVVCRGSKVCCLCSLQDQEVQPCIWEVSKNNTSACVHCVRVHTLGAGLRDHYLTVLSGTGS